MSSNSPPTSTDKERKRIEKLARNPRDFLISAVVSGIAGFLFVLLGWDAVDAYAARYNDLNSNTNQALSDTYVMAWGLFLLFQACAMTSEWRFARAIQALLLENEHLRQRRR